MIYYFCIALGVYLGAMCTNWKEFKEHNAESYFLGVIGAAFFPLALVMLFLGSEAFPPRNK